MRGSLNRQRQSLKARPQVELLEDRTLLSAASFVPNELLVKFKDGVGAADKALVRALVHADRVEHILTDAMRAAGDSGLELLHVLADVPGAAAVLAHNPHVAYAEPNWILTHQAIDLNDPLYTNGSLWGMESDDSPVAVGPSGTTNIYGSQAEEAWAAGNIGSNTVYVGIIDEGIQFTHPDLAANVWTNPFDLVNGIDDDRNGYIDDTHGWDFVSNNNSIYDGTGDDHGTHVTGTIGAAGGNGIGVAGVNWNIRYISGKFLGSSGGTTANAIKAVDYMTDLKVRHGLNIVATNNSWGGGGFSQGLLDAITRAANEDILFIAAAGNSNNNNDAFASYPSNYNTTAGAGYDAVIAVASINSIGAKSSFSSYGATTVDLGAPGEGIVSTVPTNGYSSYSGTSMATPHVTGAAALYASTHPGASAEVIRSAILGTTTPTSSLNGRTVTGGRLNISDLMAGSASPTFSISDMTLDEGDDGTTEFTFTVTLSAPSTLPVTVQYATGGGSATSGIDYTAASGMLTFIPGDTTETVTVSVNRDTGSEPNETFIVTLTSASGASIADGQGVGTILNDDGLLSINNVTKPEGNSSTTAFTFTVSLQNASTKTVTVNYATADDTATAGSGDYSVVSLTPLTFTPGQTSKTVTVSVNGNTIIEPDETFFVNLTNPGNAAIGDDKGIGTILDDDNLPGISIGDVSQAEGNRGNTVFTFTVSLSAASAVTVQYATGGGTASSSGNTKDYTAISGTLTFALGEMAKTITVSVKGDTKAELDETFFVTLSNPTNATLADNQAMGTIKNDDTGPVSVSAFIETASPTPKTLTASGPNLTPAPAPAGTAPSSDVSGLDAYFTSIGSADPWLAGFAHGKDPAASLEDWLILK